MTGGPHRSTRMYILPSRVALPRGCMNMLALQRIAYEKSFYINFHEEIYCAILAMTDRGDRADIVSIMPELKKRNVEFTPFELASITQNHTFDLVQYACRLNELEKRRSLYELGQYLVSNGSNESEDIEEIVQSANDKLSSIFGGLENHVKTASDYMTEVYQRVNDNLNSISTPGTLTGFSAIDSKGGFQPTNLIICAAESSQGKTAFANAVTLSATKAGEKRPLMMGSSLMFLMRMEGAIRCDFMLYKDNVNL